MTQTSSVKLSQQRPDKKTIIAALTYLVFFLPRFTQFKEDREMHYHMRQSLGLFIAGLSMQGVISILGYWGLGTWRVWPVRLILLYLVFMGVRNVLAKRLVPLPWIGTYAERIF